MARLSRQDWTDMSLKVLEEEGFTALRAESLARRLGVSRGSFYWHFEDVEAFEEATLERWRELVLAALDTTLAGSTPPEDRLRTLLGRSMKSLRRVEIMMRAWGTVKPSIRRALDRIDGKRLAYMTALVKECPGPVEKAEARARIAYFVYLGHAMSSRLDDGQLDQIVEEIVALATAP